MLKVILTMIKKGGKPSRKASAFAIASAFVKTSADTEADTSADTEAQGKKGKEGSGDGLRTWKRGSR